MILAVAALKGCCWRAGVITAIGGIAAFGFTVLSELLKRADQEQRLTIEYVEKSINKLGSEKEWDRVAALSALEGVAKQDPRLLPLVANSLHVFIRKGHPPNHHVKSDDREGSLPVVASDVQLAVDILGRQDKEGRSPVVLRGERFLGAAFTGNFSGASFLDTTFFGTDFSNGTFKNADFRGTKLSDWEAYKDATGGFDDFRPAEWVPETSSDHWKRYRYGANFSNADLTNARFDGAGLNGAIFRGAVLENTSFKYAAVSGADFAGAKDVNLAGACSDGCTRGPDGHFLALETCSKPLAPDRARQCK